MLEILVKILVYSSEKDTKPFQNRTFVLIMLFLSYIKIIVGGQQP